MLLVIILLTVASFLWAVSTYLDKHLLSNVSNNDYKGLFIFSSLVSAIIFIPLYLFLSGFNLQIDLTAFFYIFLLAACEVGYLIFYLKATSKEDTSVITALFQFIPIFTYFLGVLFLHEQLTLTQIISGLIIIGATVSLSIKFENKKLNKNKLFAMLFMVIASLILGFQTMGFKISVLNTNYFTTMFYFQVCLLGFGIVGFLIKPFRKSFLTLFSNSGKKVLGFNILNETLNATAGALKVYCLGFVPIAFVSLYQNGTQVIIAFIMGILLTVYRPKKFREDISKKTLIKKIVCIVIASVAMVFFVGIL